MKKNRLVKAGISCVLTGILMAGSLTSFASYQTIYEEKTSEAVYAEGVTRENIQRFTDGGWLNIEVIRVALEAPVKMDVVVNEYLSSRDTLSNIVKKNNANKDIVAAMNADYFDVKNNTTMGHVVKDSEILTTSIGVDQFASFNISGKGVPYVAYINQTKNRLSSADAEVKVDYFNKPYLKFNRVIYYDRLWDDHSLGNTAGTPVIEVVVEDGVITAIHKDAPPVEIPENGYVVSAVGEGIGLVEKAFEVGDAVTIEKDANLGLMQMVVGGGTQLVKDGKLATFTQSSGGYQPRSALGINKARNELIMVTVDGRRNPYRGMTFTELAKLMMELGAYEAINFDGGGSTQIMGKAPWEETLSVLNTPSDGGERRMYTGLVVRKERQDAPTLKGVKLDLGQEKYYMGTSIPLKLIAFDSNYDEMTVDYDKVIWSVSGVKGTFKDNLFVPSESGKATIQAVYEGQRAEATIEVLKGAQRLIVSPSQLALSQNQKQGVSFSVQTASGETFEIPAYAVGFEKHVSVGEYDPISATYRSGDTTGQGYLTFTFEGLKTHVPVSIGTKAFKLYDFEKPTATARPYPEAVTGHYFENPNLSRSGQSGQLVYDFSQTEGTRAVYMDFNAMSVLPTNATGIGMWVYGDEGNGHWLRAHVTDVEGKQHFLTLARNVNWKGWKYLKADLPEGIVGPVTLNRLYLVETDDQKKSAGFIAVDDVEVLLANEVLMDLPKNVTKVKALNAYALPQGVTEKSDRVFNIGYAKKWKETLALLPEDRKLKWVDTENGFNAEFVNGAWLVTVNNKGLSIKNNGIGQWKKIFEFLELNAKAPVIVVMNDGFAFKDPLEKSLFYRKFEALEGDITVVHPTTLKEPLLRYYEGVRVLHLPYATDKTLPYATFAVKDGTIHFKIGEETLKTKS